jgi:tight adherence protein B
MGARPLHVLLGTSRGQVALLVGAGLDALGLLWTARIVAAAGGDA